MPLRRSQKRRGQGGKGVGVWDRTHRGSSPGEREWRSLVVEHRRL